MRNLQLVAAGIGIGQDLAGVENGPAAWLNFFREHHPRLLAAEPNTTVMKIKAPAQHLRTNKESKNFPFEAYDVLADQIFQAQKNGYLPVSLGGDHSVAMGTVMGSLRANPNMKVVWIDAHADINTPETTLTGRVHGMPLAYLLGLWAQDRLRPRLLEKNVVLFGVRDLDTGEKKIIRDLGIKVIPQSEINRYGVGACWDKVAQHLALDNSAVHVSFDVDAMDPKLFPQTGVPVKRGLNAYHMRVLFQKLKSLQGLQALDIVEFNPEVTLDKMPPIDGRHLLGELLESLTQSVQKQHQFKEPNHSASAENMAWPNLAY